MMSTTNSFLPQMVDLQNARLAGEILRRQKLETERIQMAEKAIEVLRKQVDAATAREATQARIHTLSIRQLEHEFWPRTC